jgi:cytochrome c553
MEYLKMIRMMIVLAGMALLVPAVHAEPSSEVAFDVPTLKMLKSADPAAGKELATETKCAKCHGDAGISDDEDDINIAGMSASYIFKQLRDYKDKKRDARDMYKLVRDMDDQQLANLSAWYASLEPAPPNPNRVLTDEVRTLVYRGDPERLLKSCASCHGQDGRGGQFDNPALAGQHKTYLIDSMTEFKEGDRENDVYGRMRDVSTRLTEAEIEALAEYYALYLPPEEDEEE